MPGVLTRWDPFAELAEVRSRFDRMFDALNTSPEGSWMPAIDVVRNGDKVTVHAEVPGIKPDEVKIEIEDDVLTISGEHEEQKEDKNERYLRRERRYGSFSRSLSLPAGVDTSAIKATTHDGIVEVTIPLPTQPSKEKVTIQATGA
jgi:HSP20 family protein